jgi:hypothetical protein
MSTVMATAVAAAGIGAIGASQGATPWEQAISNLAMAGHAGSASSQGQPTTSVFDAVIAQQPNAPKTQEPAGSLQLDSHESSAPSIVGALSDNEAPESAAGGVIGKPLTAAPTAVSQPAGVQPSASQTQFVPGNLALGNLAPGDRVPGNPAPGNPAPGSLAPGEPAPGSPAPGNLAPAPGQPAPAPGSPAAGKPAPKPALAVPTAGKPAHARTAHADAVHVTPARAHRVIAHRAPVHHAQVRPYQIYDSVTPSNIPWHKTAAVYANGAYAASSAQVAGRGHVLWIDTNGSDPHADALDVEPGDATPAGAAAWVQNKLNSDHKSVAIVYTMISQWQAVKDNVAGLPHWMQDKVRYWIADPTGVDHVLSGANATQWYWGKSYDITTANPGFWS